MIMDKILSFFGIQKFSQDLPLLDGTIIRIDGIFGDTNVPVFVITPDGPLPLPDGEYPLGGDFEGSLIVVGDGIIKDIIRIDDDSEPETDEPAEPSAETDPVEPDSAPDVEVEPVVEKKIEDLIVKYDELLKRIEALENGKTEMSEELSKIKNDFSKIDGAPPVKKIKNDEASPLLDVKNPVARVIADKKNKK